MCTVSWLHHEDGYQLLCNRDEKRTRRRAFGPVLAERDGVRVISPVDGESGGSWISVNEFGVSLCLLNGANLSGHERVEPRREYRSRGLLLSELALAESTQELCERAWILDLSPYAPFTLAALEPGRGTALFEWDGEGKAVVPYGEPYLPLVSSSFDAEAVRRKRRAEFLRVGEGRTPDAARLYAFHESHGPGAGAYSPCMHRVDAETVSFSWVKVTWQQAEFFYSPGPPCEFRPGQTQTLALVQ